MARGRRPKQELVIAVLLEGEPSACPPTIINYPNSNKLDESQT